MNKLLNDYLMYTLTGFLVAAACILILPVLIILLPFAGLGYVGVKFLNYLEDSA